MVINLFKKHGIKAHFLNLVLVLFFILPQSMILYLFVPIALLIMYDKNRKIEKSTRLWINIILGILLFSFIFNYFSPWYNHKSMLKAIQLALLLFCFGRIKSFMIIKGYIVFLLFYLALFQFAYQLNVPFVERLLSILYPLSEEEVASYSFIQELTFSDLGDYSRRLGGIYYNPNICAYFFECLLLIFINERKQFKKWYFYAFIIILIVCIMSTGSRTSFLVLVLIALTSFSRISLKSVLRIGTLFLLFGILSYYIGSDARLFQVNEGLNDSFSEKVVILFKYLQNQDSIILLLFGSFTTASLPYIIDNFSFVGTDFEIGDVIVSYGFVGLVCLVCFLANVFFILAKQYRAIYCILLWCFSNTIFMSYRGAAVFLLLLNVFYMRTMLEKRPK